MKKLIIFSLFIFFGLDLAAQQLEDFGFVPDMSVTVKDSLMNNLPQPWLGGLNSCQFAEIDLNLDGIRDLFIFDNSSNRILTFINNGTPGTIDYTYAPQYREKFPKISDWVELVDYNCDGKMDIFTSSNGGITVYKNVSDISYGLKFNLVTNNIMAIYDTTSTSQLAIYVSTVDYPGIADIDNDGDLDVVSFFILGTYVSYYRNMSMETYGNCDSLNFIKENDCWGEFEESQYNNQINLNITCPYKVSNGSDVDGDGPTPPKHTGSTLLVADLNGDNLKDLLLGDVGFFKVVKLTNGGTAAEALMVAKDTMFPSNSTKISLISFPVPCMLDVNNDGTKDLLVSPFGGQTTAENLESCWLYKNNGTTSSPVFDYQYSNFLQRDMIETGAGAYPVFADYNADGLQDLFIGDFGVYDSSYYSFGNLVCKYKSGIALYKNTGTSTAPAFEFVTNDFGNILQRKLNGVIPTFGDVDGDSAMEMIIGKSDGSIDYYNNTAATGQPMNMVLTQANYQSINVGKFAAPQLVDLDRDSLLDLVIGERNGNLNYYRNTGTKTNPVFTHITDTLGWVDVVKHAQSNYGYSVPCFFQDSTGHFRLLLGSESGYIYSYNNIDSNLTGHFTLRDSMLLNIYEGVRSGVAIAMLDDDNYPDMITGNYGGGVIYYKGVTPPPVGITEYHQSEMINMEVYPNPVDDKLFIKFPANISYEHSNIRVFNMVGQELACNYIRSEKNACLDVSYFKEGLYCFVVSGFDAISGKALAGSGKFIVNHLSVHQATDN